MYRSRTVAASLLRAPDFVAASLSHDIPVVLDIVRESLRLDGVKTRTREILAGLLFAPHRAEAFAALRERHGHAVHARDRIEQRAERMIPVLVRVARSADVLHHVDAVVLQ